SSRARRRWRLRNGRSNSFRADIRNRSRVAGCRWGATRSVSPTGQRQSRRVSVSGVVVSNDPGSVLERLLEALNAHDLDAFVACFHDAYESEQPAHPARAFSGRKQVRKNWGAM